MFVWKPAATRWKLCVCLVVPDDGAAVLPGNSANNGPPSTFWKVGVAWERAWVYVCICPLIYFEQVLNNLRNNPDCFINNPSEK